MKNHLIYLASPYSKFPEGRQKAYELVCKKAASLMLDGHDIFCPIAHSHPIEVFGGIDPAKATHDFWLKQDFAVLSKCQELWVYMMPGWKESFGVNAELKFAAEWDIPVSYLEYHEPQKDLLKVVREWISAG